jgi:hypothetical protein
MLFIQLHAQLNLVDRILSKRKLTGGQLCPGHRPGSERGADQQRQDGMRKGCHGDFDPARHPAGVCEAE